MEQQHIVVDRVIKGSVPTDICVHLYKEGGIFVLEVLRSLLPNLVKSAVKEGDVLKVSFV